MMPRQSIRSSVFAAGSVREELIDHSDRQTDFAVDGLLLRCLGACQPRFQPNAVEHLVEKGGIATLRLHLVGFPRPRSSPAGATRRLRGRFAGLLPGPPRLAPCATNLANLAGLETLGL